MSMRIIKTLTRLRPEDAHRLSEFLDDAHDTLMQRYGGEIRPCCGKQKPRVGREILTKMTNCFSGQPERSH